MANIIKVSQFDVYPFFSIKHQEITNFYNTTHLWNFITTFYPFFIIFIKLYLIKKIKIKKLPSLSTIFFPHRTLTNDSAGNKILLKKKALQKMRTMKVD